MIINNITRWKGEMKSLQLNARGGKVSTLLVTEGPKRQKPQLFLPPPAN